MVLSVPVKFATKYLLQIRSKRTKPNASLQRTELVAIGISKPVEIKKNRESNQSSKSCLILNTNLFGRKVFQKVPQAESFATNWQVYFAAPDLPYTASIISAKLFSQGRGQTPKLFTIFEQSITEFDGLLTGVGYSSVDIGLTSFTANFSNVSTILKIASANPYHVVEPLPQ